MMKINYGSMTTWILQIDDCRMYFSIVFILILAIDRDKYKSSRLTLSIEVLHERIKLDIERLTGKC